MDENQPGFLRELSRGVLDTLNTYAALELAQRYAPNDPTVFTQTPGQAPAPRGEPVRPQTPAAGGLQVEQLLLFAAAAYVLTKVL